MEFGQDKCVTLAIKREKIEYFFRIELRNTTKIKALTMEESYNYLGILERNNIWHAQTKIGKIGKTNQKSLKLKLNSGNKNKTINIGAIAAQQLLLTVHKWNYILQAIKSQNV